jgi:hypothetical protein
MKRKQWNKNFSSSTIHVWMDIKKSWKHIPGMNVKMEQHIFAGLK